MANRVPCPSQWMTNKRKLYTEDNKLTKETTFQDSECALIIYRHSSTGYSFTCSKQNA